MRVLAIVLLGLCASAHANVYTYNGGTESTKPHTALTGSDVVRYCHADGGQPLQPGSTTGCTAHTNIPFAQAQSYTWLWTTDGWCRRESLPCGVSAPLPPPTPDPEPPEPEFQFSGFPCKPKSWSEIRVGREGNAAAALWYCDLPNVIWASYYCGNPANIPAAILTSSLEAVGLLAESKVSRHCTAEEVALVSRLHAAEGVKITVQTNGTYADRPVYARNADNTRGAVVKGVRAPVGAECGRSRLQTSTGARTNYFRFEDKGYTLCKVEGALSKP